MARNPKYDILFQPIRIGPKVMKNRFYKAPHCSGFGVDKPGTQAAFRAMAAEGGWAAIHTETCSIHPSSDFFPHSESRLWTEGDVRNLALMCDKIHDHGSLAGIELYYAGAHALNTVTRTPPRGVSQIPSDDVMQLMYPSEMDEAEIAELRGWYVEAARRARAAGFDIINVYGGHAASITQQFLMRFYNKRTDGYGGSFENRARFWKEAIEEVKAAVGDSCAISARICIDTLQEGDVGIRVDEEAVAFVELVDHLVDLWDLQVSKAPEWGFDAGPSRFFAENHQREWVRRLRPHTSKPIVGVGRFTNPDTMVRAIADGQLDVIGAARPSIADPFLPRKIEEGRLDEIRECIGCNVCVAKGTGYPVPGNHLGCTQNATAGEEYRRGWHPERFSRARNAENDVLVVGAGPAGMECAIVLAKRGLRRVHLVEANDAIGGALRWITRLPGLGEWGRVVDWRTVQLAKLANVEVITKARLSADEVLAYGAELVVVATGSFWVGDGLNPQTHETVPGADSSLPYVLTPEQIVVEGKAVEGDRVAVICMDPYFVGPSIAERLALSGKQVTLVTQFPKLAPFMEYTLELWDMQRRLHALGVEVVTGHYPARIDRSKVDLRNTLVEEGFELATDAVVLVTQRRSDDTLYRELRSRGPAALADQGIRGLYRVGDCVAPQLIADAIFSGHRLGREIDSADPSQPLPYVLEYRIVGASEEDYASLAAVGGGARVESSGSQPPRLA